LFQSIFGGQTIEEWGEDHEMTFAQAIRRLVELGLKAKKVPN
jgi:hypothetical protein